MALKPLVSDPNDPAPIANFPLAGPVPKLPPTLQPLVTNPRMDQENSLRSKISAFENPQKPTGFWQNLRHITSQVAQGVGSSINPNAVAAIPGTQLHNERLNQQHVQELQGLENQDRQEQETASENALRGQQAEFYAQRPAIEQSKIDQKQQAVRDRVAQQAASHGQKVTWDDQGNPSYSDDPELLAHAAQQAQIDLRNAQAAFDASKNDPNSPVFQQNERRLQIARANAQAAQIRAGAYQGTYLMRAYGVGQNGEALPGVGMIDGTPVGTSMQGTVNKSISGNAQFDDVQQGLSHTNSALEALSNSGGSLNSPAMSAALHHSTTGLGTWLQSQAASTLTPQERDAVVSIQAMRERILAMRKASGGNASEAQVDRMISMLPGPQTPDLDTAQRQLREVQAQLDTLRPGVPQVNRPSEHKNVSAPSAGPKAGEVVDGYRFKGGNPADQKNWEKQ